MALLDKMKSKTSDLVENAQNSREAKREEKDAKQEAEQREREENQRLLDLFKPTKELGDISIDMEHRLFKVKNAAGVTTKKKSGALKKTGKAVAAVYTFGASLAIEAAMTKADDKVFSFDVLDGYELIEDDSAISSGGLGAAVAGGALFGNVGAVVGGITGSKKQKKAVENLILQINTTDITFPCVMVTYIKKTTKVSSNAYREALSLAKQSMQCLDLILRDEESRLPGAQGTAQGTDAVAAQPSAPAADDPMTQVKKLKELLDIGAITEAEFETKKKEILGL